MAVIAFNGTRYVLDGMLQPAEFWSETTYVDNVIILMPLEQIYYLHQELVSMFHKWGIQVSIEDNTVFGLKDIDDKMWYFGFRDQYLRLGTSVRSKDYSTPNIRPYLTWEGVG